MINVKELREQFAALHSEAVKYAEEFSSKEETEEGKKAQADRFAKLDKYQKQLDEQEKLAKYSFENNAPEVQKAVVTEAQKAFEKSESKKDFKADKNKYAENINLWANYGVDRMDSEYATITTATQSNVFLPREIASPVLPTSVNVFRDGIAAQGMVGIAQIETPTAAAMKVPVITGVAGGLVAENAGSETDGTPTLTESFDLNVGTYQSGSVYESNLVLSLGTFDLSNIVPTLNYEKELGLEAAIVTAMLADSNITQKVTMTGTTSAGFTYAKFQNFCRKLPKRFDTKKIILLSDDAYNAAEALTDSQNRPVMTPDVQNTELKRAWGSPVIRCSNLQAFGASAVVGMCISLIAFRLRDVANGVALAKYDQVPAKPNQTGFNLFGYHAYGYAPSAVALLVNAGS